MDENKPSFYEKVKKGYDGFSKAMNAHTGMLIAAIILIVISFIWLVGLSGVQTGSSTTSGFGSIVMSSEIDDGTVNPTYEVVAEFFIFLFLVIGVGMLAYVLTTTRAATKLLKNGQYHAALIVNGNKDVNKDTLTDAQKEQIQSNITLLGYPVTTIADGIKASKDKAIAATSAAGAAVYGMGEGAYRGATNKYNDSLEKRKKKNEDKNRKRTSKNNNDDHDNSSNTDNEDV